jgi:uncharacterized protein (TIGR02145 family)
MYYSKIGRHLACKMATLLALMFAACSNDTTQPTVAHEGGYTEETGIYANLENITISGKARRTTGSPNEGGESANFIGFEKGTLVTLYELDSVTFAKTDIVLHDTIGDESGSFCFPNITLTSPYVLVTAEQPIPENAYALTSFADVRHTDSISLDILTHLQSLRALHLAQTGTAFAEAQEQAKTQVLEAFGIYEIPEGNDTESKLEYSAMVYALSGAFPTWSTECRSSEEMIICDSLLAVLFDNIAEWGHLQNIDSTLKKHFKHEVNAAIGTLQFDLSVPSELHEKAGHNWGRYYQIEKRMMKYYAGMQSALLGAGRCDQSSEGRILEGPKHNKNLYTMVDYNLVCRSGNWHLTSLDIEHTVGTMTDPRDGQSYKTVTIDAGGVSQTWMAEDLKYNSGDGALCSDTALAIGEKLASGGSCYYSRLAMLNIDSSYLISTYPYESEDECRNSFGPDSIVYGGIDAYCDKESYTYIDWNRLNHSDSAVYQGVCPDGWRLPKPEDWETLFSSIQTLLGESESSASDFLFNIAEMGDPIDFGLSSRFGFSWLGDVVKDSWSMVYMQTGADYATAPGEIYPETNDDGDTLDYYASNEIRLGIVMRHEFRETQIPLPVRCIKN